MKDSDRIARDIAAGNLVDVTDEDDRRPVGNQVKMPGKPIGNNKGTGKPGAIQHPRQTNQTKQVTQAAKPKRVGPVAVVLTLIVLIGTIGIILSELLCLIGIGEGVKYSLGYNIILTVLALNIRKKWQIQFIEYVAFANLAVVILMLVLILRETGIFSWMQLQMGI